MKLKKATVILLAIVFTTMGLSGCGSNSDNTGATSGNGESKNDIAGEGTTTKEVHLLTAWNEDQDSTAILKQLTEDYNEANPNSTIDLEIEVVAQSDMNQKLSVLAASNDLPDVFCTGTQEYINDYVEQGLLKSIDEIIEERGFTSTISAENREALLHLTKQEALYVLPMDQSIEGIWYNKQMFEEHGLQEPATVDDFMDICKTLYDQGIQPMVCAGKEQWPITRLIGAYATQAGGTELLVDANNGDISWADESFQQSYSWLKEMGEKEYFGPGVTTIDTDTANSMFLSGSAAMQYNGSWFAKDLNSDQNTLGENVGFFAFPSVEGGKGIENTFTTSYGMFWCFKEKAYDDEMGAWIEYVIENYGDVAMSTQGRLTAYETKNDYDLGYFVNLIVEAKENAGASAVWPEYAMTTDVQDIEYANAQLLILGQMEPEAFGKAMDDAMAVKK